MKSITIKSLFQEVVRETNAMSAMLGLPSLTEQDCMSDEMRAEIGAAFATTSPMWTEEQATAFARGVNKWDHCMACAERNFPGHRCDPSRSYRGFELLKETDKSGK